MGKGGGEGSWPRKQHFSERCSEVIHKSYICLPSLCSSRISLSANIRAEVTATDTAECWYLLLWLAVFFRDCRGLSRLLPSFLPPDSCPMHVQKATKKTIGRLICTEHPPLFKHCLLGICCFPLSLMQSHEKEARAPMEGKDH